jgi:predicted DNA-binding transcriptional regulator AlpA
MKKNQMQIIRVPELQAWLGGVSRSTIFRWVRDKKFPAPIHLGANSIGWLEYQVNSWLKQRSKEIKE